MQKDEQKAVQEVKEPQVVTVEVTEADRTPQVVEVVQWVEGKSKPASKIKTNMYREPATTAEADDGMRFKCDACSSYTMPDPEGSGMKCDGCGKWFTLCEKCMPDVNAYSADAVWLCQGCR